VSVTFPRGFRAGSVTAGSKPSGLPDLGLLVDPGTTAAGVFTTNLVSAAPIRLSRARLASGSPRAVLVNSGQANAATGARGDALTATASAAVALGLASAEVLPCSTGVIGEPLHLPELDAALPALVDALSTEGGEDFARAIMTTDSVDKRATGEVDGIRVGGCAKGVGMIAPNLATMLVFVTTDAAVSAPDLPADDPGAAGPAVQRAVGGRLDEHERHRAAARERRRGGSADGNGSFVWARLAEAVASVGESLLRQPAADAEGASHVLIVEVEGADAEADARAMAKAVADSPLVKTAAFGGDPNPGRILQAAGAAGVGFDVGSLDVFIGDVQVAEGGVVPPSYFEDDALIEKARAQMGAPEIAIRATVGDGPGRSRAMGCDLSYEYIRINGEYTT